MSDSGGEEVQLGDADDHTPHVHGEWRGAGGAKSRCQAIRTTSDTLLAVRAGMILFTSPPRPPPPTTQMLCCDPFARVGVSS
jgi:hypothetical protein